MTIPKEPAFERRGRSAELVILLHAYGHTGSDLASVRQVVAGRKPDADVFCPDLPTSVWSCTSPDVIVDDLLESVDRIWAERLAGGAPYESITIVGHSLGGLIGRKLYVAACGETDGVPFGSANGAVSPRAWAAAVDRIVLLAGMNNGWRVDHHLSPRQAVVWRVGVCLGKLMQFVRRREPTIFAIRRGAVFLTELRLQWISMRVHAAARGVGDALTIQLLGSVDDMVSPRDNLDLVTGRDFVYLDVPHSGHANVIEMDDASRGADRAEVFTAALRDTPEELRERQVVPADNPVGEPDGDVDDVVFVIHGIRDEGYWTHKVARRVQQLGAAENRTIATKTSSYGYFPILRFLLPGARQQKVHWFIDRYVEVVAQYPNARLSFVGHSHGTFLLASALEHYRCCRFERVVFAGSVVRTKYDWDAYLASGQVRAVANYVASSDWVVAFFPRAIQMLGLQDLGSAGHDGFESTAVSQVRFVRGAHGAAIQEDNWSSIAEFIVHGSDAETPALLRTTERSPVVAVPGAVAPLVSILLIVIVCLIGWCIWQAAFALGLGESIATLACVGYVFAIWWLLIKA